jgi:hypothetical protein
MAAGYRSHRLLVAVVWAVFVTPNSSSRVGDPLRLVLEPAIFGRAS